MCPRSVIRKGKSDKQLTVQSQVSSPQRSQSSLALLSLCVNAEPVPVSAVVVLSRVCHDNHVGGGAAMLVRFTSIILRRVG